MSNKTTQEKAPNSRNKLSIVESNQIIKDYKGEPNVGVSYEAKQNASFISTSRDARTMRETSASIIKALQEYGFDVWVRHARIFRLETKTEVYDRVLKSGVDYIPTSYLEQQEVIDPKGGSSRVIIIDPNTKEVVFDAQSQCSMDDQFNRVVGTIICLSYVTDFLSREKRLNVTITEQTDITAKITPYRV